MGVWSDATDGFDEGLDRPLEIIGYGAAGVYHANQPGIWDGPTGIYVTDFRAALPGAEPMTWEPLYLWANPDAYTYPLMYLSFEPTADPAPPTSRNYTLELLYVPPDVVGAPPVGATWEIPPDEEFMLEVPTFWTYDPEESYRFAFTAGPATCTADIGGPAGAPDGVTSLSDLAVLLASYGLCAGDPGFVEEADFTGAGDVPDGCVTLADLAVLLADYGCGL